MPGFLSSTHGTHTGWRKDACWKLAIKGSKLEQGPFKEMSYLIVFLNHLHYSKNLGVEINIKLYSHFLKKAVESCPFRWCLQRGQRDNTGCKAFAFSAAESGFCSPDILRIL